MLVGGLPLCYKLNQVSDSVTMIVLGILAGVGVAYGFVNVKDAKVDLDKLKVEVKADAAAAISSSQAS